VAEIDRLLAIMAKLRDPDEGCPWDREQDFASIAPYTVEEAYEVADAIARGDMEDLRDELGDLLLQVVYHAQMAREAGLFDFDDVVRGLAAKLVRRHPHVFGDAEGRGVSAVRTTWEDTKARERAERHARRDAGDARGAPPDPFGDVPVALPALRRAAKIQSRAERTGCGADDPLLAEAFRDPLIDRLEGAATVRGDARDDAVAAREGMGDLLFRLVAVARHLGVDPERALAERTRAFEARARARADD
jgi:MazG family protein